MSSDFNRSQSKADYARVTGLITGAITGKFRISPECKGECLTFLDGLAVMIESDRRVDDMSRQAETSTLSKLKQFLLGTARFSDGVKAEVLTIFEAVTKRYKP